MIDADPRTEVIVPPGLEHLINVNTEYQKVICIGKGCGYANELSIKQWVRHLQRHKVPNDIVVEASSFIKGLGWERSLTSREAVPPHGLAPQPGIKVIDGVRCTYCQAFISTNTVEVKMHWELDGHGASDGCLVELVRIQSWARNDDKQSYPARTYWEVDEGTKKSGTDQGEYKQASGCKVGQTSKNVTDDWEEISNWE
jgi:hypothetical protein